MKIGQVISDDELRKLDFTFDRSYGLWNVWFKDNLRILIDAETNIIQIINDISNPLPDEV